MAKNATKENSGMRARLFQVATRLFARQGYGATSVSMIVNEAGVTKPVLYYYFGSKQGLFDALFEEHFSDFTSIMEKALREEHSLRDRLRTLTREQFAYCMRFPDRFRFVLQTVIGPEQGLGHLKFDEFKRLMGSKLNIMFSQALSSGQLGDRNLELMGLSYIGMVHMFMMKHTLDPDFELNVESADFLVELFLEGARTKSHQQE